LFRAQKINTADAHILVERALLIINHIDETIATPLNPEEV
jgi:hypothetical protein